MKWRQLLFVLVGVAAACSGSSSGTVEATDTNAETDVESPPDPELFCTDANRFVTDSSVRFLTTPDAVLFDNIDDQLRRLVGLAPREILGEVETLRSGFDAIDAAYATTGYEPSSSFVLPADIQQSSAAARINLERYLIQECALDEIRAQQIDEIQVAFGIEDAAVAECLHAQMGNVANIDPSALTPELMTATVCGTSILGLLSGATTSDT